MLYARFDGIEAAREEAGLHAAEMLKRIQAAGDKVAAELTAELDLPAGMRVVYEAEPIIKAPPSPLP